MFKLVVVLISLFTALGCSVGKVSSASNTPKPIEISEPDQGLGNPKDPVNSPPAGKDPAKVGRKFSKVIYIVFENEDQKNVISNAYFKSLAEKGVNFTNLKAEIHPSQGNYIAMVAGDPYGINHDGNVDLNVPHLADLLENKNKTWKTYAEGFPENCFKGSRSGKYARKHSPFMSFVNITNDKKRCANIVSEKTFFSDWRSGNLPNFSMYIPDLNNDGHDTSIDYSAKWLKTNFESYFNNVELMKDTLIVLTYDESTARGKNKVYSVLLGPSVIAGSVVSEQHSHSSFIKMMETEWDLGTLNRDDAKALPLIGIWK